MKGRNPNLITLRNQYLIRRYYYWYDIQRQRMDDVLEILSTKEIFLDVDYILHLVRNNNHLLKELRAAKPTIAKLAEFKFTSMQVTAATQSALEFAMTA